MKYGLRTLILGITIKRIKNTILFTKLAVVEKFAINELYLLILFKNIPPKNLLGAQISSGVLFSSWIATHLSEARNDG